ncbi:MULTISPECIES: lanthionine synthetase LanC family protein [unclassified Deinococcus]|uniref:lanthionine synthetase LanC family protein n=1 Tax=unclassified Deinococcus TaxID=2623546 RepID=UPI001C30B553|nr:MULTISPECIES: lanthionine synthetase LanC family protein [unclassified Deinococcus]MDK2014679.1 hypothetical protein [Deinococcus sp. 43]
MFEKIVVNDFILNKQRFIDIHKRNKEEIDKFSIFSGNLGMSIIISSFFEDHLHISQDYVIDSLKEIETRREILHSLSLFDGLGSLIIAMSSLKSKDVSIKMYDQLIEWYLNETIKNIKELGEKDIIYSYQIDFISGITGSVYALRFLDNYLSEKNTIYSGYIDLIDDIWNRDEAILVSNLKNQNQPYEEGKYVDMGIAHGIMGILGVLVYIYKNTQVKKYKNRHIISKIVKFTINCISKNDIKVPDIIKITDKKITPVFGHRNAWCYGNLGAFLMLKKCMTIVEFDINEILCCMRITKDEISENLLLSHNICHGSSGLLQASISFGEEEDRKAIYNDLLNRIDYSDEYFGFYDSYSGDDGARLVEKSFSLLAGSLGPIVCLLNESNQQKHSEVIQSLFLFD